MTNKLYVGNLSYEVTDEKLTELFSKAGKITSAIVIMDRNTGRSKGFGFIEFASEGEAQAAIETFNEQEFEGRKLIVSEARPQKPRSNYPTGGTRRI